MQHILLPEKSLRSILGFLVHIRRMRISFSFSFSHKFVFVCSSKCHALVWLVNMKKGEIIVELFHFGMYTERESFWWNDSKQVEGKVDVHSWKVYFNNFAPMNSFIYSNILMEKPKRRSNRRAFSKFICIKRIKSDQIMKIYILFVIKKNIELMFTLVV